MDEGCDSSMHNGGIDGADCSLCPSAHGPRPFSRGRPPPTAAAAALIAALVGGVSSPRIWGLEGFPLSSPGNLSLSALNEAAGKEVMKTSKGAAAFALI